MSDVLSGMWIVAGQEFRVRLRTGRWRWLLGAWFLVITAFMVLVRVAIGRAPADVVENELGVPMFGALMLWVLALALLVAPAMSAQGINGDRERGTLATLQVTRLSALEIAGGKLLASWGIAAVFLAFTLPHVMWSIAAGGVTVVRAIVVLAVVLLLCGMVCAVALALSALLARGILSAVLSYVVVFALTVGTLVSFGIAMTLTTETVRRPMPPVAVPQDMQRAYPDDGPRMMTTTEAHPERVWWLLAPNPFVVLADAAPALPLRRDPVTGQWESSGFDPLGVIGQAVREARTPDERVTPLTRVEQRDGEPRGLPVWPWGLAFDVLLGAGAFAVTVARLRTPSYRLPRGVRIA